MNELLQKHGCSNVFTIPDGLRELMSDISREVLREQPASIFEFIANYLSALLVTREHGILAVKILEDLCDCRPSVSEHLMQYGMPKDEAHATAEIIKQEVEKVNVVEGREKLKEAEIIKKILKRIMLDEEMTANVCQVARNAYKDYWYRKKLLEQSLKNIPDQPWEIAAERTIELYKKTKPSFSELTRATQKIQAAYKGYYVRKKMLKHLKPKKKHAPKVDLFGPPLDVAESRNIDLGRVVEIKVKTDPVERTFADEDSRSLGLSYDPTKTITNVLDDKPVERTDYNYGDTASIKSEPWKAESAVNTGMRSYPDQNMQGQQFTVQESESRKGISFGPPSYNDAEMPTQDIPEEINYAAADMGNVTLTTITDDRIEDDIESMPLTSEPSSVPTTAPSTDVEDMADFSGTEG